MKKYLYMAVAAIAALSSCSKNEPIIDETGKQALIFTATMEGSETRAIYDSEHHCASWEEGDSISINGIKYIADSAGLTTTFGSEVWHLMESPYNAYFACIYYRDRSALPGVINETWADGKFNMPMYATSNTTDLEFKNLCGVLKITVTSGQIAAVKRIKVSSANMAMSGEFTVNNNAAELIKSNSNYVNNTFTVTYTDAVPTTAEGTVFYVAVPAQTYQGLRIRLDADGNGFTKSMTTKSGMDITVERNKIYPITFAHNGGAAPASGAGTTGKANATIDNEVVKVNWVQLWAGGPKFAEKNVGADSSIDAGDLKMFEVAAPEEGDYVWGSNWRTPSKDEMDELVKAAAGAGSTKVECDYVMIGNGKWGFRFTGKENGYTGNSVFFPVKRFVRLDVYSYGDIYVGSVDYWSTNTDNEASFMGLYYTVIRGWDSRWYIDDQKAGSRLVRPVLNEVQNN